MPDDPDALHFPTDHVERDKLAARVLDAIANRQLVFQRDGALVDVREVVTPATPTSTVRELQIKPLSRNRLAAIVRTNCRFSKLVDAEEQRVPVPETLIGDMLGSNLASVPYIHGIWNAPTITNASRICVGQQFDPETGWFVNFHSNAFNNFNPALVDVRDTAERILGVFNFVNFRSDLDRSVFLCGLLTAVLGPACENVPAIGITSGDRTHSKDHDNEGSSAGKTTLARLLGIFATGKVPPLPPIGKSIAEMEASINLERYKENWFIPLDNVTGAVDGPNLNRILTTPLSSVPFMGRSYIRYAPFLVLTGNDLDIQGDFKRRVLCLEILPRDGDVDAGILDRILSWRRVLIEKLCKLVAGADKQRRTGPRAPVSSFEAWSALVRDTAIEAGLPDPKGALYSEIEMEKATPATRQTRPPELFHDYLFALTEGRKFTASDLASKLGSGFLSDEVRPPLANADGTCTPLSIGKSLAKMKNIKAGSHTIAEAGSSGGVKSWIVLDEP